MRLFKIVFSTVLLMSIVVGCSSIDSKHFEGENLALPFVEELKNWQLFQKEEIGFRSNMWQKPGERWADTYAVSIYTGQQVNLADKRKEMDAPGLESCQHFVSEQVKHPKIQDYEYLFWETDCIINGQRVAKVLHLMIQGEDSFYQIQKAWRSGFTEQEVELWRNRFIDTFVCDNRKSNTRCPAPD